MEFRILQLLWAFSCPILVSTLEIIPDFKISEIKKLANQGLISMTDKEIQITESGLKKLKILHEKEFEEQHCALR